MDCDPEKLKKLVEDKKVEFDADIAGLGLSSQPQSLRSSYCIRRLCHRPLGGSSTPNHAKEVDIRNERIASYKAFLHSANDQLLVSLVAIMIGAVITSSKITIYSSNIVIAIGCLALAVYLGCVPFYMDRLRDHKIAMIVRILAILSGVVMLLFMLSLRLSDTWNMKTHVYLKCAMKDYILNGWVLLRRSTTVILYLAVLYGACEVVWVLYKQQSPDIGSGGRPPQGQQGTSLATEIVQQSRHNPEIEMQQTLQVPNRLLEYRSGNSGLNLSTIEREVLAVYEIMVRNLTDDTGRLANIQNNYNQSAVTLFEPNTVPMTFREIWRKTRAEQRSALLNKFFQLVGMGKIRDHWGFGQIVAIALLILPLFAAMESRADYKRRIKSIAASYDETSTEPADGDSTNPSFNHHTTGHEFVQGAGCPSDIEAIQFVGELFRRRAAAMGYPCLHNWVWGISLEESPTLQRSAVCQSIFILALATALGKYVQFYQANFLLGLGFVFAFGMMAIGRVSGLAQMVKVTKCRCLPGFLEKLDDDLSDDFS
ncbi:hypothetical protein FAUST_1503 [Fusarium austroamericanum]|uniref:Uncharacterized protein n=1 Tax=Fusarium austroamericanum TaxID=282268 RepID=A0AAN6HJI0_FUSAU|nr:hypothetical protein FAUST_1503 [Fusarium austroamericanum]